MAQLAPATQQHTPESDYRFTAKHLRDLLDLADAAAAAGDFRDAAECLTGGLDDLRRHLARLTCFCLRG